MLKEKYVWVVVAGGWMFSCFFEESLPSQAEFLSLVSWDSNLSLNLHFIDKREQRGREIEKVFVTIVPMTSFASQLLLREIFFTKLFFA